MTDKGERGEQWANHAGIEVEVEFAVRVRAEDADRSIALLRHTGMDPPTTSLLLPLTPKERKRLVTLLRYEGVDPGDPVAVKDWILDQVGIELEREVHAAD